MKSDQLKKTILQPGYNCWRAEKAAYASVIVDVANYYRALHSPILKAKHSIFIIGWDIDSRIELIGGEDAKDGVPITLFD